MYVHTYKNILCGMCAYCVLCICIYSVCAQLYYIVWWYREKPLAIYAFSTNKQAQKRLSSSTSSGGFVVNDVMIHFSGMLVCLCVCVYICICVCTCMCVYIIYVCVYVFTVYVCLVYVYLVYVYICVYTYVCRVYVCVYVHVYVCIYVCVCVCVCLHVLYVCTCVCCMYVCACVSKHACIDMCINVRTSTYLYVCLSTYILHIIMICKIVFLFIGCIFPCISTNTTIWRGR